MSAEVGMISPHVGMARDVPTLQCNAGVNLQLTAHVRMTAERVALIDWDESHVDVADLDLLLPPGCAKTHQSCERSV